MRPLFEEEGDAVLDRTDAVADDVDGTRLMRSSKSGQRSFSDDDDDGSFRKSDSEQHCCES